MAEKSRFRVSIEELEAAANVPTDEQVVSVPEPPGEVVPTADEFNRARALSPTGDFRLNP